MKKYLILLFLFISSPAWAATYYVATDGSGDYTTIAQVSAATFAAGDSVLFRRGDTFRGTTHFVDGGSSSGYITYGAYGTGAKPKILQSVQENNLVDWTDEGSNIWSTAASSFTADVGNIIFDNETSVGVKCVLETDLNVQDEFWYDSTNDLIKVYSVGNPASVHSNIECATRQVWHGFWQINSKTNIIIENLDFRYCGVHAINTGTSVSDIIIRDCDFSYIGGCYLGSPIRGGNAVQFWDDVSNIIVERCHFDNNYDEAFTCQIYAADQNNIIFRNNIVKGSYYGVTLWNGENAGVIGTTSNIYVYHNTFINNGKGWSATQRSNAVHGYAFALGLLDGIPQLNINVKDNLFYEDDGTIYTISINSAVDETALSFDNNLYYMSSGNMIYWQGSIYTLAQFAAYQLATGQDSHSIASDPTLNSNYYPLPGSPVINAGTDVGIDTDYRNYPRDNTPSIGAIEYTQGVEYQNCKISGMK